MQKTSSVILTAFKMTEKSLNKSSPMYFLHMRRVKNILFHMLKLSQTTR